LAQKDQTVTNPSPAKNPVANTRHEAFAQALAMGSAVDAAYVATENFTNVPPQERA
jgi:hypothetical protein